MRGNIKYLVMDVDGTLTDGGLYIGPEGETMKCFSVKDGCGIRDIFMSAGGVPIIITGRQSDIVQRRCNELGIDILRQGVRSKKAELEAICASNGNHLSCAAYIGDDLNDLECMEAVKAAGGLVGCPADACRQAVELADYVCSAKGGEGAVREFIEWLVDTGESCCAG